MSAPKARYPRCLCCRQAKGERDGKDTCETCAASCKQLIGDVFKRGDACPVVQRSRKSAKRGAETQRAKRELAEIRRAK